jgi:hypothetical protein
MSGGALLLALAVILEQGESAKTPLKVEGQGGFWNQVVVGVDKAYGSRIGGLTVKGGRPVASFVDRETPMEFKKRWDVMSEGSRLTFRRASDKRLLSLDSSGNAIFKGKMKVDGVLRVKNLKLSGDKAKPDSGFTLKIGASATSSMRLGSSGQQAWVQSDKKEHLALNPHIKGKTDGVMMFSSQAPKHPLDVKGDMFVEATMKLGTGSNATTTTLSGKQLTFAMGGGWTGKHPAWISSLDTKPVQFSGAVFGTRMGVGTEVKKGDFRLQVHNGHFVVTGKIGKFLKGLTTYVMPRGSHVKAYDYTRKKLQKWRITGTTIFLNPGQKTDGRVCVGCEKPEHHLQSEGNMYVNGNVFVNMHLHVKGNMHIDKIITPRVFIHSRSETPEFGRGVMIGNDLPNKYKTKTNMRIGYNKGYAWVQSHKEVPLVINPIGGATCIGCQRPSKKIELEIGGHGYVNGELFVATLKKKKKKGKKGKAAKGEELEADESLSLAEAKSMFENEMGATELNVMSAWSSAAKIAQANHAKITHRQSQIDSNEAAIQALERQMLALSQARTA